MQTASSRLQFTLQGGGEAFCHRPEETSGSTGLYAFYRFLSRSLLHTAGVGVGVQAVIEIKQQREDHTKGKKQWLLLDCSYESIILRCQWKEAVVSFVDVFT